MKKKIIVLSRRVRQVLSGLLPEDEEFVSLPDALLYQVEQQHHLSRVFQEAGLVVIHDVPRLPT